MNINAAVRPKQDGHARNQVLFSSRVAWYHVLCFLFARCRKVALRRRTRRLQPSTDIHLRMRLAAVMPSPFGGRCFCIPLNHGQFYTATSDNEPVDRIGTHRATHLTSELCNRRHQDYRASELIQSPTIPRPRSCPPPATSWTCSLHSRSRSDLL
jgi:hypothetical protein